MSRAYGYSSYGGAETEIWFDRPVPAPGPSELLIDVKAVGVNPVDHKIRSGAMANPNVTPSFPRVLGVEAAGVVVTVGSDAAGFSEGDEVMGIAAPGHGTYARHAVLRGEATTAKPAKISFVQAAALPVAGGTAWDALEALEVAEGETLFINGIGGGVGVMAAQLARNRGASVFGSASAAKRQLVESIGAALVDYTAGDAAEQMRTLMPGGLDSVFDLIGGASMHRLAALAIDPARVVSIADPAVADLGGRHLFGSQAGVAEVAAMVADGKLDPKVLESYPFDEAAQALRAVESGHVLGKVVIDLGQTTSV